MSRSKFCDAVRFAARAILPLCAFVLLAPAFANASTAEFDTPTDPPTRTMPFNIEGVEGMRLWTQNDANGPIYLGIGTTLPLYPLHVIGEAAIGYGPGSSGGLIFTPSATYGNPAMQSVTSAFATSPLLLNPAGGGVGIGTAVTPAAALDVNGAIRATGSTSPGGVPTTIALTHNCTPHGAMGYDMSGDFAGILRQRRNVAGAVANGIRRCVAFGDCSRKHG